MIKWQDFKDVTDREIERIVENDHNRSSGLAPAGQLAMKKNRKHPLHQAARDILAAHFFREVTKGRLYNSEGYEVTNQDLKLASADYKLLVRKAYAMGDTGITYAKRRLVYG